MSRATSATITVVGSLNIDVVAAVQSLPRPGETVAASSLTRRFGGKGANQALAAARQGARVTLIGCVGDDAEGRNYLDNLRRDKVTVSTIRTSRGDSTGSAFIALDPKGENMIMVHPGANGQVTPATVRSQRARIDVASALLLQLEVPMDAVLEAVKIAHTSKVPIVLNPSPIAADFPWGVHAVNVLITNEGEAEQIFGLKPEAMKDHQTDWLQQLKDKKIATLIVTRGAKSTLALHEGAFHEAPAHPVEALDTVGAGDAFAGAFTAQFYAGTGFEQALRLANVAGALTTLKPGAQEGIPMSGDVLVALGATQA